MATIFGFTVIKWPSADRHVEKHEVLLNKLSQHHDTLKDLERTMQASIAAQQVELGRIQTLRTRTGDFLAK